VDTRTICHRVRLSSRRAHLCGALRGRHGGINHHNWHTLLLRGRRVEE